MKANVITLLMLLAVCFSASAQDDDMYSFSSKKKTQQSAYTTTRQVTPDYSDDEGDANADYHTGQLRDVDEYNRRGPAQQGDNPSYRLGGDTLLVENAPAGSSLSGYDAGYDDGYYDGLVDGDFYYTSRLARYRSFRLYDPYVWDYCYGWYDPWYDPWYGGWHHPHYYGGYYHGGYGWHGGRHLTTASRNYGQRSATYSGRSGGGRSSYGRGGPSRSQATGASRGSTRSAGTPSSRGIGTRGTYQYPSRGNAQSGVTRGATTSRGSSMRLARSLETSPAM